MGGYAINGKYSEVDAGVSYTLNDFTLGVYDYYYPTVDGKEDKYLGGGKHTGHWLEASLTYAPAKLPLWATLSNFFYGADKYIDSKGKEKQAYSTYLELGTYYDFLHSNRISLAAGAAFNKSCYNNYEHDFSVVNLELKYTYTVQLKSRWQLPLNVAYIYNPVFDKSFVNFTCALYVQQENGKYITKNGGTEFSTAGSAKLADISAAKKEMSDALTNNFETYFQKTATSAAAKLSDYTQTGNASVDRKSVV